MDRDFHTTDRALASDERMRDLHFRGRPGLLPLWIAEPYIPLSPALVEAIEKRASVGWYGYEARHPGLVDAFWRWMETRHGWDGTGLTASTSPSVGTSIAVLLELFSEPGDGVIVQAPVFTDFKPMIVASGRRVVRNPLTLEAGRYGMDLEALADAASASSVRAMILCNPHNPVGRVWSAAELRAVAEIAAENDVAVIADEIHADICLGRSRFQPFAESAEGLGIRWAATHGPIKTFGLAGVADTLLVTDNETIRKRFRATTSRYRLVRNNVFGLAAFETAYQSGGSWLDGLLDLVEENRVVLQECLPPEVGLVASEGTYLAWLDFRRLGLDVRALATWLVESAGVALSPGHWFGREGAGFARMTIAAPTPLVREAAERIARAVETRSR